MIKRFYITFSPALQVDELVSKFSLANINQIRLKKYGIMSADMDDSRLEELQQQPNIYSVKEVTND